jgi:hypothetical protein
MKDGHHGFEQQTWYIIGVKSILEADASSQVHTVSAWAILKPILSLKPGPFKALPDRALIDQDPLGVL